MRRFLSLLAAPAIALGLMAFQDAANKYTIDFPPDWKDLGIADTGFKGFRAPDGLTVCTAKAADVPALANITQDQINAEFSKPMDIGGWVNLLGADASLVELVEGDAREIGGKYLQIATLSLKQGFESLPFETKARYGVVVIPGALIVAGCVTKPESFDQYKDVFEKTISSLRPL
jgi:hypothetical protein